MVQNAVWQLRQEVSGTRKQDGRRFTRYTSQSQNQSGNDVGHPHKAESHARWFAAWSRPKARLPSRKLSGNRLQGFFGGAYHQRYTKAIPTSKEPARDAVAEPHVFHKQCHTKQTEHNGRNTAQVIGHHPDKSGPALPFRRILVHINATHHSHRKSEQRTARHQIKSTYNGRPYTATRHAVTGRRGQKLPADYSYTFIYNKTENGEQNGDNAITQQFENAECQPLRGTSLRTPCPTGKHLASYLKYLINHLSIYPYTHWLRCVPHDH